MLNREEIEKIARERGQQANIIEKDYLLEMVLFLLQEYGKNLIFKGGTALYKLHSLPRFSEDLDFTLKGKIDTDKVIKTVMRKLQLAGISGRVKEVSVYGNQQNIRLELRGPLFDGNPHNANVITINISMKEKPIYDGNEERIYPKYRDIPSFTVVVMPLQEILAEKIRALFTREKPRDVFDIWFLCEKGVSTSLRDVNKKLKLYKEKFSREKFIEKIEDKRKAWEMDLKVLMNGKLPDFNNIKKEIVDHSDNLVKDN
ncbi:MAG: nucleotidyl transferase AbiEii/AbiGii toxin family protein [Candidatus Woesearchaeota archaeon]|nr:nucleotidyl transferase AbiEii/AbiGii toxin family protein [Candidatus Woesearchaeota archaeon]